MIDTLGKLFVRVWQVVQLPQILSQKLLPERLAGAMHRQQNTQPNLQAQTLCIDALQSGKQYTPVQSKWKCIGASVIGATHRGYTPCQDSHQYKWVNSGALVVAVSDGAGSAKCSDKGSQLACAAAVSSLKQTMSNSERITEESLRIACGEAFQAAFQAIQVEAHSQQAAIADYAATLLILVCTNDFVMTGMVGDGAVVILRTDGCLEYILSPQRGEYANEAYFVTSNGARTKLQIKVLQTQVQAVAMMTDALLKISGNYKKQRPHPGFFSTMFQFICSVTDERDGYTELMEFLDSDRVNQNTDDDKTLVLVVDSQLTEVFVQDESSRSEQSNIHPRERNSQPRRGEIVNGAGQSAVVGQALPHTELGTRTQTNGDDGTDAQATQRFGGSVAGETIVRETSDGLAEGICGLLNATSGQNSNALPRVSSRDQTETISRD